MTLTRRLVISGRVQGVGYRTWAVREARALGLSGWVRNRSDGSVEALVTGAPEAVAAFAARCRQGPRFAEVTAVLEEPSAEPVPPGFVERPTA